MLRSAQAKLSKTGRFYRVSFILTKGFPPCW